MVLKQQNVCPQNPFFAIEDALFCDEQEQDFDFGCGFGSSDVEDQILNDKDSNLGYYQQDVLWEEDEEKDNNINAQLMFLMMSGAFVKDKPWMNQLVAVTCLSLASKVEEIQAPLLLDLQMEGTKFVFEAKTIMKMELLVLSTLEWKMNPVTPLAFFDYVMRRLGLMTRGLHFEFLRRCERILLSVVNDSRFQGFLPSVMAAAIMCVVSKEIEPDNALDFRIQLMNILNISEENMDRCSKFIMDVSNDHGSCYFQTHKRKYSSVPGSPIASSVTVDAYFSSDNSNNSWTTASSVTSSPEVQFKRNRAQEQQMRLTPVNRMPIAVLSNPH
ncbi:hypothetical protein M8C21_018409 [Ambrosia artemisiifolia]|uniref:Cyclin C-terminal domain-containing protein n=1 Tax=Ambrosia artemisiifolia TaxID=4212 RepID=A0AAD5G518_AMBAR|nr:hypothetical protein M8C21_018409 [Ambrosia artemisiifolia]